jgi:peptidoglycan/LPS O-acetylase OafA/YrhL
MLSATSGIGGVMKGSNGGYRPDIDGLRAIAVLAVVMFHAFPGAFRGGFVGVDIFFVISGFLISTILLTSLERGSYSIVEFYRRRVRRIFPALLTVIATTAAAGWFLLLPDELGQLGKHIAAGAGFVSNIVLYRESGYFDRGGEDKLMLHLWSLAVEEQYYIVWPLLLAAVWRWKRGFLAVVSGVAAVSFAANLILMERDPSAAFYWPIARFWELMVGGALAHVALHRPDWAKGFDNAKTWAGVVLLAAGFALINPQRAFPSWWALLPVLGSALVIAAGPSAWFNRHVLANRAMVWVGLISYPLYLWHWPLLSMSHITDGGTASRNQRIALVLASIVLAWLTYVLVEKPIREQRKIPTPALAGAMVLLFAVGMGVFLQDGFEGRKVYGVKRMAPVNQQEPLPPLSALTDTCRDSGLDATLQPLCIGRVNPSAGRQVVVLGDSQAAGWMGSAAKAAREDGYGVTVISNPGCPPLFGVRQSPGPLDRSACTKLGETDKVIEAILRMKPAALVLVARWDLYYRGFTRNGKVEKTIHFLTTAADTPASAASTRDALARQLPATAHRIQQEGVVPVIALNPPVLRGNVQNLRMEVAVTAADQRQVLMHNIARNAGLQLFDPAAKMCPAAGACALYDTKGAPLYTDDNHLSPAGSLYMYPEVRELLRSVLAQPAPDRIARESRVPVDLLDQQSVPEVQLANRSQCCHRDCPSIPQPHRAAG